MPVPVLGPITVEYNHRNPYKYDHMRAPGLDYFKRYQEVFSGVQIFPQLIFRKDIRHFCTKIVKTGQILCR